MKKKTGGMRKARIKALNQNCRSMEKLLSRKYQNRIDLAVTSRICVREKPPHIHDLIVERTCINAEITALTIRECDIETSLNSNLLTNKLKRLKKINNKLEYVGKGG